MNNFLNNIECKRIVITEVRYLANDYLNYPEQAKLQGIDTYKVKDINKHGMIVNYSRKIDSEENNFVSFYVSFDLIFSFKSLYDPDEMLSKEEIEKIINEHPESFDNNCSARSSLIIAQISSQTNGGVPIISPAQPMK